MFKPGSARYTALTVDSLMSLQVVVDAFNPSVLASSCATKVIDFLTVKEESLHSISIPLELQVSPVPEKCTYYHRKDET